MIAEVSAVTFRQRLGEMLARVQYGGDTIIVTRDGDRAAALIDSALFDQIRTLRSRFDELCGRVATGYTDTPETEGRAEIDAVAAAVRRGH